MAITATTGKQEISQVAMKAAEILVTSTKEDSTMVPKALQEAQQRISGGTQVPSTPTCPSGTCPHSVGKELNVPGA
jgi:hypothetical protein